MVDDGLGKDLFLSSFPDAFSQYLYIIQVPMLQTTRNNNETKRLLASGKKIRRLGNAIWKKFASRYNMTTLDFQRKNNTNSLIILRILSNWYDRKFTNIRFENDKWSFYVFLIINKPIDLQNIIRYQYHMYIKHNTYKFRNLY